MSIHGLIHDYHIDFRLLLLATGTAISLLLVAATTSPASADLHVASAKSIQTLKPSNIVQRTLPVTRTIPLEQSNVAGDVSTGGNARMEAPVLSQRGLAAGLFSALVAVVLVGARQLLCNKKADVEQLPFITLALAAQEAPPRVHPVHGSEPAWMNRPPGRAPVPEQFMVTDLSKEDLSAKLTECPVTKWAPLKGSVDQLQSEALAAVKEAGTFPLEVRATPEDDALGVAYFLNRKEQIRADLKKHGCIWFRGFSLMQDIAGYRSFWEAVGMTACLDPIHSSGLRKFASARDGLYEEVNKPQLRQHYIGLHQESSAKRTAAAAAFVCFQRATVEGGRFFVADGAAILADMKPDTVKRLVDSGVRISVSNIDTPLKDKEGLSGVGRNLLKGAVETFVAPKFDMDLEMIWEADGTPGRLQAVEEHVLPVIRHPQTGVPVWFCNAHNHLRFLRDRRPCAVPEVGMTDVYMGKDLRPFSPEDCDEVRRACEKNIVAVPMEPGDVLLIDNYRALHGRDTFEGDRYHAVTWFTWDDPAWREEKAEDVTKNVFNKVINQYMDFLPKDF